MEITQQIYQKTSPVFKAATNVGMPIVKLIPIVGGVTKGMSCKKFAKKAVANGFTTISAYSQVGMPTAGSKLCTALFQGGVPQMSVLLFDDNAKKLLIVQKKAGTSQRSILKTDMINFDDIRAVRSDNDTSNWSHATYHEGVFVDTINVKHKTYCDALWLEFDVVNAKGKTKTWRVDYIKTGALAKAYGAVANQPMGTDANSQAVGKLIDNCVRTFAMIKHAGNLS